MLGETCWFKAVHTLPHPPQLVGLVLVLIVQPPVAGLVQNEKPGLQVAEEQTPAAQVWVAVLAKAQTILHLPQEEVLVLVLTSQPF